MKVTKITAAKARGDAYSEAADLIDARLALWIDVEGCSPSVSWRLQV